jgi:hypothetical protein
LTALRNALKDCGRRRTVQQPQPHVSIDVAPQPCPLCRQPIVAGDSAGRHGGRVLHLDCYIAVLRTSGELLAHLKARAGAPYCTTCLVGAVAVTFDEVGLAHGWLRARPGIRIEVARCAACGGRRVTLAFGTQAAG